jgi:hypothetical protein
VSDSSCRSDSPKSARAIATGTAEAAKPLPVGRECLIRGLARSQLRSAAAKLTMRD